MSAAPIGERPETVIHPTALVHPEAQLGAGVTVGPFSIVGPHVRLLDGVRLHGHVVVEGHTTLHDDVEVYPFAAVGLPPQDRKYDGSATTLVVGARTVIRESATLQPGSVGPGCGETTVGADCLLMAYTHVAHDCVVGDGVIMANATQIAGHCVIEDFAILGGVTTVHQFVRVGTRAITGASARVQQDVPPFTMADGHPAGLVGLTAVGLERAGVPAEARAALKRAFRALFVRGPYAEALSELERGLGAQPKEVATLVRFLSASQRGVMRTRKPRR